MGDFFVEAGEGVRFTSRSSAASPQNFKIVRERPGFERELLGGYNPGSAQTFRVFQERVKYIISAYALDNSDWLPCDEQKEVLDQERTIIFRYDDYRHDGDFDDLVVTFTIIPNAGALFEFTTVPTLLP